MTENFWITILITAIITAVIVVMLTKWQSFCKNLWKMICIIAIGALVVCLLCMANYAIFQSFQPHSVRIENSSNVPMEKMVSVESYKATYDLFSSQFSQLLTFLGFFGTIFGLVIPAGAYLLQRQNLREEREKLQKEIDKINSADQQLKKINEIQNDQYITEKTNFYGLLALAHDIINHTADKSRKISILHIIIVSFDNAVNCAAKADDSEGLFHLFKYTLNVIYNYYKHEKNLFDETIELMEKGKITTDDPRFESGEKILHVLGVEHEDMFEKYKEIYSQIYPKKFRKTR